MASRVPAVRANNRALEHVPKLAHVARPEMGFQGCGGIARECGGGPSHTRRRLAKKERGERQNVTDPFAERRHDQREHAEPVVQVTAERAVLNSLFDAWLDRSDDTRPDLEGRIPAQPFPAFFFDQAQQLGLSVEGQLADPVEVDASASGEFKSAGARGRRIREGSSLVTKQLGLKERRGQTGAVDFDEWLVTSRPGGMQGPCDGVLAGAGLAEDQDVGIGVRKPLQLGEERAHRTAAGNERRSHVVRREDRPALHTLARTWRRGFRNLDAFGAPPEAVERVERAGLRAEDMHDEIKVVQ